MAQEAIENEERMAEASRKPGASPPRKKPVSLQSKKQKEKESSEDRIKDFEFKFTRVDVMTLICVYLSCTDKSFSPDMIRFWCCNLTDASIRTINKMMMRDSRYRYNIDNVIDKLFICYNDPLLDQSLYSDLMDHTKRLQMISLYECNVGIECARQLLARVGPEHHHIYYIDLYGNNIGNELIDMFTEVLSRYDMIEYVGMGKNMLSSIV